MKYSEKMVEHYYKELLSVRMAEEKLVEIYARGGSPAISTAAWARRLPMSVP